ncbi:hypothetical protein RHMOL_Rhmol06G0068900 [Rhododendron molle]|uniref:Uncharacterized protein n=1 Tax=Rhododendron molle TaxID=49168 RepID=A0ACC0NB93_RHOML|nr:hypothetical protein RHMOL_Rhmol06G0068900 [Rhododendron molle]
MVTIDRPNDGEIVVGYGFSEPCRKAIGIFATEWKPADKILFAEIRKSQTERDEDAANVSYGDEIENRGDRDDRSREMRRIRIGVSINWEELMAAEVASGVDGGGGRRWWWC